MQNTMKNINQSIKNYMEVDISTKMNNVERAIKMPSDDVRRGVLYNLFTFTIFDRTLRRHLKSKIGYESIKIWKGKR